MNQVKSEDQGRSMMNKQIPFTKPNNGSQSPLRSVLIPEIKLHLFRNVLLVTEMSTDDTRTVWVNLFTNTSIFFALRL